MDQLSLWSKKWDNCVLRTIMILTLDENSPNLMFSHIFIYQRAFLASNQDFCTHLTENHHVEFSSSDRAAPLPSCRNLESYMLDNA